MTGANKERSSEIKPHTWWGDPNDPKSPCNAVMFLNGRAYLGVRVDERDVGKYDGYSWISRTTYVRKGRSPCMGEQILVEYKRTGLDETWRIIPRLLERQITVKELIHMTNPSDVCKFVPFKIVEEFEIENLVEEARERGSEISVKILMKDENLKFNYEFLKKAVGIRNDFVRRWWSKYEVAHLNGSK